MNCRHARLLIGADPRSISPDVAKHIWTCAACAQLRDEMEALDGDIRRALQQPPPTAIPPPPSAFVAVRRHAMAASIAVMTMMITVTWMMRPTDSLAHDVVAHVNSESPSQPGFAPIDAGALQDVLRKSGVRAHLTSNEVIHEKTCLFRWHFVPHLVVQTSDGPITLVILPDEQVEKRARFQEGGLAGVILPASRGSIVVLARNETRVDEFAGRLQKARLGS